MPNQFLQFFGLDGPAGEEGTAGRSGIDPKDPRWPSTPYGSLILVEPVWAERKDSAKFSIGKNGPVGNRHFVVPWGDNNDGTPFWQDYVGELLGEVVFVTADGITVVSVTPPKSFHPTIPFLVCQEVDVEGENWQGPDKYGMIQFRTALLKAKYTPLDFAEKVDTQVKFQSIPGYRWQWIGQDARQALANQVIKVTTPVQNANEILTGVLALNIQGSILPGSGANPFFAFVKVNLTSMTQQISLIMPQIQQLPIIAGAHVSTLGIADVLTVLVGDIQAAISTAVIQQNFISTGLAQNDRPNMAVMQESALTMFALFLSIQNEAEDLRNSLNDLAGAGVQAAQVTQTLNAMALIVPQLRNARDGIASNIDNALFAIPTPIEGVIRIDYDNPNGRTGTNPANIQAQIDAITLTPGTAAVSAIETSSSRGYEIRLFRNLTVTIRESSVDIQDMARAATLEAEVIGSQFTGVYNLTVRHAVTANFSVTIGNTAEQGADLRFNPSVGMVNNGFSSNGSDTAVVGDNLRAIGLLGAPQGDAFGVVLPVERGQFASVEPSPVMTYRISIPSLGGAQFPALNAQGLRRDSPLQFTFVQPNTRPASFEVRPTNQENSQLVRGDFLGGRYVNNAHFSIEKHFILAPLLQQFLSLVSCVNQVSFRGFPPWTLLLESIQARKTHLMDVQGTEAWTMTFKFAFNPNTWNATYRSTTSQYEFVRAIGRPQPGPNGTVQITLPAVPAIPAGENGQPATLARDAETITITPQPYLTIFGKFGEPVQIPIMTRGQGSPISFPTGPNTIGTVFASAVDYGMLYPVADMSIIDTFF